MTKEEDNIDNIEALRFALNNQINWQKYGEAKLLLLITISASSLASLNKIFIHFEPFENQNTFKIVVSIFAICSIISLIIGLYNITISFKIVNKFNYRDYTKKLISWRYVKDRTIPELIEESKTYNIEEQRIDLIIEHLIGSKLTMKKYSAFNIGVRIYGIGVVLLFSYSLIVKVF